MTKPIMEIVLPNLAKRLQGQLKRYQNGKVDDAGFAKNFANLLQKQFCWLATHGLSESDAALTVHAAVLVLSRPGLKIEALESGVPLEHIECRAIRSAAADIAEHYEVDEMTAFNSIADAVAQYSG